MVENRQWRSAVIVLKSRVVDRHASGCCLVPHFVNHGRAAVRISGPSSRSAAARVVVVVAVRPHSNRRTNHSR